MVFLLLSCPRKQWTIKCKGGKQSDLGQEGNKGQNSHLPVTETHPTVSQCIPVYLCVSLLYLSVPQPTVSQCILGVFQVYLRDKTAKRQKLRDKKTGKDKTVVRGSDGSEVLRVSE